ncbi:host cell division inhibitor Icd-like protein [Serratia fonticola]|nr:host cell division inhibitor Icd-like protein [Serratia fonticola]NYA37128.1 host cell division inhibitor Icd-like protein [Serratia fonticola]
MLPFRSKAGLDFSSCIGTYQYCRVNLNGTYQTLIKQQKQRNPAVVQTHTGLLTTNDRLDIEVAMLDHITPLTGRNSHTPNKFTWRFLALSRIDRKAKPCRLSVVAHTEREARKVLAPHFILSLAARVPVREVHHV